MGSSVFNDLLRRVDDAVTFDELRALRRFCRGRLDGDDRLKDLEGAIERKAMAMITESESAARKQQQ